MTYVQNPHPVAEQQMHLHGNRTDHAPPQDQQGHVVANSGVYVRDSRSGDGGEEGEGGGGGEGLVAQMSQMQLKDPTYYEATPYSSGASSTRAYLVSAAESYPQYSISQSTLHPPSSSGSSGQQPSTQYPTGIHTVCAVRQKLRACEQENVCEIQTNRQACFIPEC